MPSRPRYNGPIERLVIAFDIGTTYSGMSYSFLRPGEEQKIYSVCKYPGQEYMPASSKVPTVICYDKQGNPRAAGAEVFLPENVDLAETEEWLKVEWFKLRLKPKTMPTKLKSSQLPPLPPRKTAVEVYGDYMGYLMKCAETFIKDTHPQIQSSWAALRAKAEFVIAHPNGWEGIQQSRLRRAAVLAKLIPDTMEGRSRIAFVSEGEASLHFCIGEGFVTDDQKSFLIADLGGGTLDFSAYRPTSSNPLRVVESAASKSELEGSAFVTLRSKVFLMEKLKGSRYGTEENVKQIAERFDEVSKRTFKSESDLVHVQFGAIDTKDDAYGIRSGKLKLAGADVAKLFEPSVHATLESVRTIIAEARPAISTLYLVGGFSASPYLTARLKEILAEFNVKISVPDGQTAKAVAEGAVLYYIDGHVSSRVSKVTYGAPSAVPYNAFDPDHLRRSEHIRIMPSGKFMVNGGFEVVLKKGTSVSEETEFKRPFFDETTSWETLNIVTMDILAYSGTGKTPKWIDEVPDPGSMKKIAKVTADTSTLQHLLKYQRSSDGTMFWKYEFQLVLKFGAPEIKAQLLWFEEGIEKRSPAQIIYDEGEDADDDDDDDDVEMDATPTPACGTLPTNMKW